MGKLFIVTLIVFSGLFFSYKNEKYEKNEKREILIKKEVKKKVIPVHVSKFRNQFLRNVKMVIEDQNALFLEKEKDFGRLGNLVENMFSSKLFDDDVLTINEIRKAFDNLSPSDKEILKVFNIEKINCFLGYFKIYNFNVSFRKKLINFLIHKKFINLKFQVFLGHFDSIMSNYLKALNNINRFEGDIDFSKGFVAMGARRVLFYAYIHGVSLKHIASPEGVFMVLSEPSDEDVHKLLSLHESARILSLLLRRDILFDIKNDKNFSYSCNPSGIFNYCEDVLDALVYRLPKKYLDKFGKRLRTLKLIKRQLEDQKKICSKIKAIDVLKEEFIYFEGDPVNHIEYNKEHFDYKMQLLKKYRFSDDLKYDISSYDDEISSYSSFDEDGVIQYKSFYPNRDISYGKEILKIFYNDGKAGTIERCDNGLCAKVSVK